MHQEVIQSVHSAFIKQFGTQPVMSWAPGRINIIGEHTDYNMGYVLPAAIDRGVAMAVQRSEKKYGTLVAADLNQKLVIEFPYQNTESQNGWPRYFIGILEELNRSGVKIEPFNLIFSADIPPGAGLSSSAALENAFVFALNDIFHLNLSRREMTEISQKAEQRYVGVKCGIMDQYASMFGKADHAIFLDCQKVRSEFIPFNANEYEWLLIDTGVKHSLAQSEYNQRRLTCESIANQLGANSLRQVTLTQLEHFKASIPEKDYQKAFFVLQENERVVKAVEAIRTEDYSTLGELMYKSHEGLQYQYQVSCEELDFLVELTRDQDCVVGSRMMGGGFGGCTLNLVRKNAYHSFLKTADEAFLNRFGNRCSSFTVRLSEGCRLITQFQK